MRKRTRAIKIPQIMMLIARTTKNITVNGN